jgi:2-dehydro-3-deoxyphosphooctonate aldolase (KDO 8-P synthase)
VTRDFGIPVVFKASYRKANRSSLHSFTGIGDEKALNVIGEISRKLDIPVTTDIHSEPEAELAASQVDIIQIPAFLCRQTDILLSAGRTGKIINIKKGQFMSPEAMKFAVEKVSTVNESVMLTERGTRFGYQDLLVDFTAVKKMQKFCKHVIVDCTHSLQRPNQSSGVTGGDPEMISTIAKAATAIGANGLFIETHPDPSKAKSDGANMLPLNQLKNLVEEISRIRSAIS